MAKKKHKYWADAHLFYNTRFLVAVYLIITIFSWYLFITIPVDCQTVNQTSISTEQADSYLVQNCSTITGHSVRVVQFR